MTDLDLFILTFTLMSSHSLLVATEVHTLYQVIFNRYKKSNVRVSSVSPENSVVVW